MLLNVTQEQKEELNKLFRAMYENNEFIDEKRLLIKDRTQNNTDIRKQIAESLKMDKKAVQKAFKEWILLKKDPEFCEQVDNLIEIVRD